MRQCEKHRGAVGAMRLGRTCIAAALCGVGAAAHAGSTNYSFTVNQPSSSVFAATSINAPIPGSVIGNYDAVTNPGGTLTIPGLFGGSGNHEIDMSVTLDASGDWATSPAGSFALNVDLDAGLVTIDDLSFALVASDPALLGLSVELLYESFHTQQPTAIFPGGVPVTLPLGDLELVAVNFAQSGPGFPGVISENQPGEYGFTAVAPVSVSAQGSFLGETFQVGPFEAEIVFLGLLTINGNDATVQLNFELGTQQNFKGPFPGGSFEDVPLDVPTVLPPGNTAHLLFSGAVESIGLILEMNAQVIADGTVGVLGDLDGDGLVNLSDLQMVIDAWGPCPKAPETCPEDLDGDGDVDIDDLFNVLGNWTG